MSGGKKPEALASLTGRIVQLQERVQRLSAEIVPALSDLNLTFRGDEWIARSYRAIQVRLEELAAALKSHDWLLSGSRTPHPVRIEEMRLYPAEFNGAVTPSAATWRATFEQDAGMLPTEDLKHVFDIYFRHDLYGRFRHPDTLFLNRGIADPWFFSPPAGVSLALDVANCQNWFGYSDPLGHIATRESVARLEQHRRRQEQLTFENIAIAQGATQGLTSILNLLNQQGIRGKILVPVPNYPPLVDQVEQHFTIERMALSKNYGWNPSEVRRKLLEDGTIGVVLPVPHNPTTDGSVYEELSELSLQCARTNRYLIIVENAFSDSVGGFLDPILAPNTIIVTSWSKTYGVAGLSMGHIVADKTFIDGFYRYASSAYGSPPSFLYLTGTTLADLELGQRLGVTNRLEKEVAETLSSPALLFREFNHWCEAEALYAEFGDLLLELISTARWFDSLERVQADPVVSSVNRILSTRLDGCSYHTFLSVLASKNVSILPVDCLAPPPDERHDLRVTMAVRPEHLIRGLTATCEELDNIYALQRQSDWLHPEDKIWLERAGLFNLDARLNFWGHVRRVQLRLKQIARSAGLITSDYLPRVAALHDLGKVWSLLDAGRARAEWERLSGDPASSCPLPLEEGELAIAKYLLSAASRLSLPVLPPMLIELLEALFTKQDTDYSLSRWPMLVDLADKTSDFRINDPVEQEDLERCLELKAAQLKLRHPQACDEIEMEFGRALQNSREIFRASQAFA
jgi:hypothetical protein